jgi:hypothetical protein
VLDTFAVDIAPFGLLALFVIAAVAIFIFNFYRKQQRREDSGLWAMRHNLQFSPDDPFGLINRDFRLFSKGDGRGCENVMWGTFKDLPVTAADYWYYERRTDGKGHTTRDYSHFSIALHTVAADLPHVWLQTENLITRLADHLSFRDIEFESEEFNRAWQVQAQDRAFAFKLIDARMMGWLLSNGSGFGFEALGSEVLVYSGRRRVDELRLLFEVGRSFVDQIPRIVWAEYGASEKR